MPCLRLYKMYALTNAINFITSVEKNNTLICIRWGLFNATGDIEWNKKFMVMYSPGDYYEWLDRKPTINLDKKTIRIEAVDCDFDLNSISVDADGIISLYWTSDTNVRYILQINQSQGESWCDICCR